MVYVPQQDISNVDKTRSAVVCGSDTPNYESHVTNGKCVSCTALMALISMQIISGWYRTCKLCLTILQQARLMQNSAWDAVFMYNIAENGTSKLLSINLSPEAGDGPRNVYPSKNGKWLYMVRRFRYSSWSLDCIG